MAIIAFHSTLSTKYYTCSYSSISLKMTNIKTFYPLNGAVAKLLFQYFLSPRLIFLLLTYILPHMFSHMLFHMFFHMLFHMFFHMLLHGLSNMLFCMFAQHII